MRRLILVPTGVLLAFAGSSAVLALGLLAEAMRLPVQASLGAAWIMAALQSGTLGLGLSALVTACFVPVCLVAVIGEAARLRSILWSAGGTGLLAAAMPSVLRRLARLPETGAVPVHEGRITVLLFLTGVAAGTIYWLVAGARTGGPR